MIVVDRLRRFIKMWPFTKKKKELSFVPKYKRQTSPAESLPQYLAVPYIGEVPPQKEAESFHFGGGDSGGGGASSSWDSSVSSSGSDSNSSCDSGSSASGSCGSFD